MYQYTFRRFEEKYLLNDEQYRALCDFLKKHTVTDRYGKSIICSIYFDTPDYRLIRASMEKPMYKEKLRLRCYGIPDNTTDAFAELKKKYDGIVYKRRASAPFYEAYSRLISGDIPESSQISREISYLYKFYGKLIPAMAIFCDRVALYDREDETLRMTFDENILCRNYDFDLRNGAYGVPLLPDGSKLLEIKCSGAFPLWLTGALDGIKAYPISFSKYANAYNRLVLCQETQNKTGGGYCA